MKSYDNVSDKELMKSKSSKEIENELIAKGDIDKNWKDFLSGKVVEDYGKNCIVEKDGKFLLWSKTMNRPFSTLGRNNELKPMVFNSLEEAKKYK